MLMPINVTFQGMLPSAALRASIEHHAERLERVAPHLQTCCATVRRNEGCQQRPGNQYLVRVRVTLPGGEFEAGHTPVPDHSHDNPYIAVRDTFNALRRQLEDFAQIRRGDIKTHLPGYPRAC